MAKKKEITVEEKLRALFDLQIIDSRIDEIRNIRGELPLEVEDLENEIQGMNVKLEKLNGDLEEFDTAITALPMLLNKDHMHELNEWGADNSIEIRWSPPLVDPDFLQIDALDDPARRERFIKYITLMDKTWNTDYRDFVNA